MASAHTMIVEPDDGRTLVLQALNAATKGIDLTIYELSDPEIISALESAQARKVAVRVLYNWDSFTPRMRETDITPVVQKLTQAGIQCRPAPRTFEVTHEKAFVIDGATAIVMSFNLTAEYFGTTRDFGIITTVPAEVAEIDAVFQADWSGKAITPKVASLLWSPDNSSAKLTSLIVSTQKTLDIYCEEAEDPGTLEAMVAAAKRGVKVRFIAAVLSGEGKINGNARGVTTLLNGGVDAVCKTFLYIHAKMALADYGTPQAQAYIGSENFSCTCLNKNRECGIIVSESAILDRLNTTYASDWAKPSVTVTPDTTPLTPCGGGATAPSKTTKTTKTTPKPVATKTKAETKTNKTKRR
jgi:phosphatidylserine/phosphatidylglycerophosphate/cardiolipin synthase-like enzyme